MLIIILFIYYMFLFIYYMFLCMIVMINIECIG